MPRFPQVKENVPVAAHELTDGIRAEVERVNAELGTEGRVLVRPSGTEPVDSGVNGGRKPPKSGGSLC